MINVLKRHVYLCAFTTSVLLFVHNLDVNAQEKVSCSSLFKSYLCDAVDAAKTVERSDQGYVKGLDTSFENVISMSQSNDTVIDLKKDKIKIDLKKDKTKKDSLKIGGTLEFNKSEKITSAVIVSKDEKSSFKKLSVTGNGEKQKSTSGKISQSVFGVKQGGFLFVDDGKVRVTDAHGIAIESAEPIFQERLLELRDNSMSLVVLEDSEIILKGHGAHGLHFRGNPSQYEYQEGELLTSLGEVRLKKTALHVPDGTAIYSDDARRYPYITVSEGSRIFADRLLDIKNNSFVALDAYASFLTGGAQVEKGSYGSIELFNKSQWTVTPRKNNNQKSIQSTDSSVSFMSVMDSSIIFRKPRDGRYQILRVGRLDDDHGLDYAYVANNARLYINAHLTANGTSKKVEADALVIYGNVYGKTKVYIVNPSVALEKGKTLRVKKEDHYDASIIQVYGKAAEDSFKLATDYVALRGAPYRYSLRAYGPNSSYGQAKGENRAIKGKNVEYNGDFWDYRLEAEYVQRSSRTAQLKNAQLKNGVSRRRVSRSIGSYPHHNNVLVGHDASAHYFEEGVKAVVPQVPTYLSMPNALFQADLMDINNYNKQLETLRTTAGALGGNGKSPAFFAQGYGGNYRYVSDLSELEYGYSGNLNYNAIAASVLLNAIEDTHHTFSFGIMGSYGKISLHPQDVKESKKSTFDKWSVTAYGSTQHDTGFYINGLLSYGFFKGDVQTQARGKTTVLKGTPLSASVIAGKSFMTGNKGLIFDPQVQVVYQNLRFDKASDIDGFDIEMGKLDQWVMRVGGRLSKTLAAFEEGQVVSFNGKLHLTNSFGGKQRVWFGDEFQLGAFGSSLETGMGLKAQLSSNFALRGDVTYQHRLSKAGFSGIIFSGGLRYHF
ncbi:autotransporter outer membrane beta-barrel domain-containing protein [Bartonella queenslandensis]|uniref:autotransporter outer membrane beta-barrel domain-containing protein n=1 Tax=Bartonella queenslandensis TaxID=481138 RepID=UPI000311F044|nr:autotransporter outer membrane beta-barrel domain-containing protein [Bartonella queenslandensis]